ncbi:MAG: hypothetical protein ACLP2X_01945 [Syntrophobacteraceae bacterium]|jgi:hypothetical protein
MELLEPRITRSREDPGRVRVKGLNDVKREIVNDALKIHKGLEESVYQRVLAKSFVNDPRLPRLRCPLEPDRQNLSA